MTSLLVNIKDETKANDVMRFLRDIDFLEVIPQKDRFNTCSTQSNRNAGLDFSKYNVNSFLGIDPLKYQQDMRNEWK